MRFNNYAGNEKTEELYQLLKKYTIENALRTKNTFLAYTKGKINHITLSFGLDYHYSSSLADELIDFF